MQLRAADRVVRETGCVQLLELDGAAHWDRPAVEGSWQNQSQVVLGPEGRRVELVEDQLEVGRQLKKDSQPQQLNQEWVVGLWEEGCYQGLKSWA